MRNIFTVAWFSIKETVRKKSFLVSNILILALILMIFAMINLVFGNYVLSTPTTNEVATNKVNSQFSENVIISSDEIDENTIVADPIEITQYEVAILDQENILDESIVNIENINFKFSYNTFENVDALKDKIINDDLYFGVNIYTENKKIQLDYFIYEDYSSGEEDFEYISSIITDFYINKILKEQNLSQETINKVLDPISTNYVELVPGKEIDIAFVIGILVSFILFMSIYLYGHSISTSISSEKSTRVIETLVTSASPSHIVLGKTLGMAVLGLIQLILIIIFTMICYQTLIPAGIDILNIYLADLQMKPIYILTILVYFILGFTIYSFLNAITGATVSKTEDTQIANLPLSFISMISFFISFFTITSDNKLSTFATLFPLSSPFSMPSRILAGVAGTEEIIGSIAMLILAIILFAFISIRIYSTAILHYGNRLKFKDLFNMFIRIK